MQAILKPLSHPQLSDILIEQPLFPIGRGEQPFAAYDADIIAHLSRRHARIFREGEGIYIADLGSRNGTRLNGKPVALKPQRLLAGDRLTLAGLLDYEVEIRSESGDTPPGESDPPALTLSPTAEGSPLDALVVTRFPYLIGKSDPGFAAADAGGPARRAFLSRRHALVFARGSQLFIEDLASTNGTWLNGERLDEHARALADGDALMLGGDCFSYTVQLRTGAPESGCGAAAGAAPPEECHTTYVTSADSFLDIFCLEADAEQPDTAREEAAGVEAQKPAAGPPARPGLLRRARAFGGELKLAFGGGQVRAARRARWILPGVLALAAAVAAGLYYAGKAQRELHGLMAQGRYREAAVLASRELAARPAPDAVVGLATEALAKYVVGQWLQRSQAGDYSGARSVLAGARPLARDNPAADGLLDTLVWVTELQQFIAARGGIDAPVQVYGQGAQIEALLGWWNRSPEEYRGRMGQLLNYVPDFKATHDQTFSQMRALRYEQSVYLAAIDKLNASIEQKLARDRPGELLAEIDDTAAQYPRLGGLEQLRSDLRDYLQVHGALQRGDRLRAAVLIEQGEYATPPFQKKVAALQATLLPSEAVAQQFKAAAQAWRAGELDTALGLLAGVAGQRGGELAAQELASKRRIVADYAQLQTLRAEPDYGERLIGFYRGLDPVEDAHFTRALTAEFQHHKAAALERADGAWNSARDSWQSYRRGGGIKGLLRLEEQVSSRFGAQARLLSAAYDSANRALRVHTLLSAAPSAERLALQRQIASEMALQRRSLQELSMVLDPAVLDSKLGLLAPAPPDTQAPASHRVRMEGKHE